MGGGAVRATAADPTALVSATLVAETVALAGDGNVEGAVYLPAEETVPTTLLPPLIPFTAQVTEVFAVPLTEAVNCCACPNCTDALVGDTPTVTGDGAVRLIDADPTALASATLVAETVALAGDGNVEGAVYLPAEEIVPTTLLPPAMPFTAQETDVFVVPLTDAVNCCDCPNSTDALVGDMPTVTGPGDGFEEVDTVKVSD